MLKTLPLVKTFAVIIAALLLAVCCMATSVTWQLESYNDWNLPFAKTVAIVGRKGFEQDPYIDGDYGHYLAVDSYLLEVDPSALFSFIFVDP